MDEKLKSYNYLWQLPKEERYIAYLHFTKGNDEYDISELLNLPPGVVNYHLQTIREIMVELEMDEPQVIQIK